MPASPCHQLALDLKAAIDKAVLENQIASAGHKGRQVAYSVVELNQKIAYYNQVRMGCPDAMADATLQYIAPLDLPAVMRGRPAVRMGRGFV